MRSSSPSAAKGWWVERANEHPILDVYWRDGGRELSKAVDKRLGGPVDQGVNRNREATKIRRHQTLRTAGTTYSKAIKTKGARPFQWCCV